MSVDIRQQQFLEAIASFEKLLGTHDKEKALATWEPIVKSHDGQLALFAEAKAGNLDAINYLFIKLVPQITGVFWKNFLGPNPRFRQQRIAQGDQNIMIFYVYQALLVSYIQNLPREEGLDVIKRNLSKAGRTVSQDELETEYDEIVGEISPLDTFDPSQFSPGTDLINKFGYYLTAVLKNKSRSYNRGENLGGISAKKLSDEEKANVKNVSFEAHFENDDQAAAKGNDFLGTEDLDAWSQFVDDDALDAGKQPTARDVLRDFLTQGGSFSADTSAEQYGVTRMTIRNRLASLKPILQSHGLDQNAFSRLITTQGGKSLAGTL